MLVPTMMSRLVDALEGGAPWRLVVAQAHPLRHRAHAGGTAAPRAALFGPILRQQYGMTEAVQPLAVLYPHEHVGDER
jgi:long-chain acyl-CoA synthetase